MRLGILGGTFDPIHHAHLFIAEEARVRYALERVLFIPNRMPPHKHNFCGADARHRYEMVCRGTAANPAFECNAIELNRPGPSFTADTLEALHAQNPAAELFFITGMDTIVEIPTWRRPADVIRLCRFVAAERPGAPIDLGERNLPADLIERVLPLPTIHLDISSTEIRRRVRERLPIRYLTPDPVVEYILAEGLYCEDAGPAAQEVAAPA